MINKKGFTLIETMIGLTLIAFVAASILGAYTQVQLNTRHVGDKNLALVLAEEKMEEVMKYPGSQMIAGTTTDYIIKNATAVVVQTTDPGVTNQLRRTITISQASTLMNVLVTVEFAKSGGSYRGRVTLNSRRGG